MVSNNVLAGLVVLAMVISLAGTATTLSMLGQVPVVLTGGITGTTSGTVTSQATISLPISSVSFGNMAVNENNDTTDYNPYPFVVQNDGSVDVNVTINATALWNGTGATTTSSYYQFNSSENETGSVFSTAADLVAFTNMTIDGAAVKCVNRLKIDTGNDAANVNINVTVPSDEPAGAKSSTVTFTAVQACATSECA